MFRFFIISLELFVLVAILRTPFMQYMLSGFQAVATDWMVEISQLAENQELGQLREVINPHMQNLNDYQKNYLDDITSSKTKVGHFHRLYCQLGDKNPYIYGASLNYLCNEINRTTLLRAT
jgi:hypothetical protein